MSSKVLAAVFLLTLVVTGPARAEMTPDQAVEELQHLLAKTPKDPDLRCRYAQALAWDNDYTESEEEYQIVLSDRPDYPAAVSGLEQLHSYEERADEDRPYRYTARAGSYHEIYNFADTGNGASVSLQDRSFHGWNASAGMSYQHRYGLDDADLGVSAAHDITWRHAYAGFTLGGATRGLLLPTLRTSLLGGLPLGFGFGAETELSYSHYTNANVYAFSPTVSWEKASFILTGGYSLSQTLYTDGGNSGALSSYLGKLGFDGWRRFKPWGSFARTKEAFEEGLSGAQNFKADHYSLGADFRLGGGWGLMTAFSYETRPDLAERINRWDAGISYSWGRIVPPHS